MYSFTYFPLKFTVNNKMKIKLIIFLFSLLLSSCSWEYEYTYEIENTLDEPIVLKTTINDDDCFRITDSIIVIQPHQTKVLAHDTSKSASAKYHVPECEYFEEDDAVVPEYIRFDVYVNDKRILRDLRTFKFWEYIAQKEHSIYVLKITEDMLDK